MKLLPLVLFLCGLAPAASAAPSSAALPPDTTAVPGLLVMAHGGDPAWNASVEAAVAPLRERVPVTIAFGMADPASLGQALDALAAQGAERVAVVRLFLDGRSFLHQTEYFLGLRPDPPARFVLHGAHGGHGAAPAAGHGAHASHGEGASAHAAHGGSHGGSAQGAAVPEPVPHRLDVALSPDGLMQAEEVAAILASRAAALSTAPADESVLILAHGTGDDVENARWIAAMEHLSGDLRGLGFHSVRAETLREDWPEARGPAERAIRSYVAAEGGEGRGVLVVPFRLSGFGPYRQVLEGLTYRAAEDGILPHAAVTDWIGAQYRDILDREGWSGE